MKRIGITGGIGMGKSTSAEWLRGQGYSLVDTDDLARAIVAPGEVAFEEIVDAFGPQVVGADGALNREALAGIVFSDPASLKRLEAITHPRIRERWKAELEVWAGQGKEAGFVVIPLLYETGAESEFEAVICVACSTVTQQSRLKHRGWTPEQAAKRVGSQMAIDEKMKRSQFVVWTEGERGLQGEQWKRILARVMNEEK